MGGGWDTQRRWFNPLAASDEQPTASQFLLLANYLGITPGEFVAWVEEAKRRTEEKKW